MADRAAVEQQLRGRSVPKQMGPYRLVQAGKLAVAVERPPQIRAGQARLAVLAFKLFRQLRDAGVKVTIDRSVNVAVTLVVTLSQPTLPPDSVDVLDRDELSFIQSNVVEAKCPQIEGASVDSPFVVINWRVSVGTRVVGGESIGEIAVSPSSTRQILSPTTGVVVAILAPVNSIVRPGQLLVTILT